MHRFYLPPSSCQGATLTLEESESHHALHVLRLREGERAVVLDGAGHEFLCEVTEVGRRSITLAMRQKNDFPKPPYSVTLIQAVTKGKTMDVIIEKATELGADRIIPILSERTVPQIDGEAADLKVEKWRTVAISAIKQCGSPWLPRIERPITPQSFLFAGERFDLVLVGSLQPGSHHPREYFDAAQAELKRLPASVAVWVGPEGDFTPAELHAIKSSGALPITLGPLVLRSDTAAIYCLSIINYEFQAARPGC